MRSMALGTAIDGPRHFPRRLLESPPIVEDQRCCEPWDGLIIRQRHTPASAEAGSGREGTTYKHSRIRRHVRKMIGVRLSGELRSLIPRQAQDLAFQGGPHSFSCVLTR